MTENPPNDNESERIDVDLEDAADPLAELRDALHGADAPAWTLEVLVEVDSSVAERYRAAFEQALEAPDEEFVELLYNYGAKDLTVSIDGHDPEYYFQKR